MGFLRGPGLNRTSKFKVYTWTPKVCRIVAFYGYWAIILPTLGGLGNVHSGGCVLLCCLHRIENPAVSSRNPAASAMKCPFVLFFVLGIVAALRKGEDFSASSEQGNLEETHGQQKAKKRCCCCNSVGTYPNDRCDGRSAVREGRFTVDCRTKGTVWEAGA